MIRVLVTYDIQSQSYSFNCTSLKLSPKDSHTFSCISPNISPFHEYIGGISWVHRGMLSTSGDTMNTLGDIMMHVGEQGDKSLSIYIENPDVLMISPHKHRDVSPMYWIPNYRTSSSVRAILSFAEKTCRQSRGLPEESRESKRYHNHVHPLSSLQVHGVAVVYFVTSVNTNIN